jgi:hypothetical protein
MDENKIKTLFPRASRSFIDANTGLPPSQSKQDSGSALVDKAQGKAESDARVGISIVMYRVRTLDPDNSYASAKPLLDGLQSCGIISGDSDKDITLSVEQVKVAHFKDEKTVLNINYP